MTMRDIVVFFSVRVSGMRTILYLLGCAQVIGVEHKMVYTHNLMRVFLKIMYTKTVDVHICTYTCT